MEPTERCVQNETYDRVDMRWVGHNGASNGGDANGQYAKDLLNALGQF